MNNNNYPYNAPQQPQYQQTPPQKTPAEKMAIASLVCGIIAFFVCGIPCGIVAIVLGTKAKNNGYVGNLATAGVICGIIALILAAVSTILMFAMMDTFMEILLGTIIA